MAYVGMSINWSTSRDYLVLDTSLFELKTGAHLWSGVTETRVKEDADRVEVVDALVARVVSRLREDGLVR
jgi:hypothetical protein